MSKGWVKGYSQVFLFGDSLTQISFSPGGWGARVADHFQRRADVLNRGFSGYNTACAKLVLPQLLVSRSQADVVTVFFGANDAALPDVKPSQHVPLPAFKSNILEMIRHLNSVGIPTSSLILITPPPLCEQPWAAVCEKKGLPMNRSSAVTKQYAEAVLEAGQEARVTTLDLHTAMMKVESLEKYLSDGLHFSPEGDIFFTDLIIPLLEEKLCGKLSVFPEWKDVDAGCPEKSFHSPTTSYMQDHVLYDKK